MRAKFSDGTSPADALELLYGDIPMETAEANFKAAAQTLQNAQRDYDLKKRIYDSKMKKNYANFERMMRGNFGQAD